MNTERMALDLRKLIRNFYDLDCKVIERGKKFVVYMKKADYISDTLALMGADQQMLVLEDIRIKKSMRNQAKRNANCDSANTNRTVECSMRQVAAIGKIAETKGLKWLPEKLQEVAILRLENPYIPIEALGEMLDPPLKKSGVNNRLKKIEEIAKNL